MIASKKFFFILLGVIVLLIATSGGVFYIYDGQLKELNQEVGKLKADEKLLDQTLGEFESRKRQIEELSFVEELASSALPQTKEQGVVVAEIKKFILDAGLNFETVSFSGGGTAGSLSQTEVPIGISGVRVLPVEAVVAPGATYAQVINLLENIEQNRRRMQVTSFSLTPENENTFSTFTINIDAYIRNEIQQTEATSTTSEEGEAI